MKTRFLLSPRKQAQAIQKTFAIKTKEKNLAKMSDDKKDKNDGKSSTWKDVGWFALKTTAISGAVLGGTALALPAIGFTAGGVAAGSLAASFQSAYLGGTIASGSAFALLQSAGAAGLAASTQAAVVAASAVVSGAHSVFKKNTKTDNDSTLKEPSESDTGVDGDEEATGKNDDTKDHSVFKKNTKTENDSTLKEPSESDTKVDGDEEATGKNDDTKDQKKTRKEKKIQVKLVRSHRNDDTSNSYKLNTQSFDNEDEMDSLREKWENVELSEDLTITQHLIKK